MGKFNCKQLETKVICSPHRRLLTTESCTEIFRKETIRICLFPANDICRMFLSFDHDLGSSGLVYIIHNVLCICRMYAECVYNVNIHNVKYTCVGFRRQNKVSEMVGHVSKVCALMI